MPTKKEEAAKKYFFRRVAKIRNEILNARTVDRVDTDAEGWTIVRYRGGAVFRMRGPAVTAALSELDLDAEAPVKQYRTPKKGEKIGRVVIRPAKTEPFRFERVYKRAVFEALGESFFVYSRRLGGLSAVHEGTGCAIFTAPAKISVADCVQRAIAELEKVGAEKLKAAITEIQEEIKKLNLQESEEAPY